MMRRGLTLIELIFSMIIIAIVFTIVPKIIFASNKSLELSIKEDALFNALTLTNMIYKLPWDPNTILSEVIILNKTPNDCNATSNYRVGGFKGSRNCIDSSYSSTSPIPNNSGATTWENINDYNGYNESQTQGRAYGLSVNVSYTDDNVKHIVTTVKGGVKMANFQSSFFYDSSNLGNININRRAW